MKIKKVQSIKTLNLFIFNINCLLLYSNRIKPTRKFDALCRTPQKAIPEMQRIQLQNIDHKVADVIYVAGTLAGWRNQLAIAAGSGVSVATDILTLRNNGVSSQSHDSLKK